MNKHTPGPWQVCDADSDNIHVGTKPMNHKTPWEYTTICNLYDDVTPEDSVTLGPWLQPHENAKANSRLIASAPDMLAMLERVTEAYAETLKNNGYTWSDAVDSSRALLAKIKGE